MRIGWPPGCSPARRNSLLKIKLLCACLLLQSDPPPLPVNELLYWVVGHRFSWPRATSEGNTVLFAPMESQGYERYVDGERDNYQIDYRRIVGDTEPARPWLSSRDPEHNLHGTFSHNPPHGHGHGHETAAQRYSATRLQAGYEPERWDAATFLRNSTAVYTHVGHLCKRSPDQTTFLLMLVEQMYSMPGKKH